MRSILFTPCALVLVAACGGGAKLDKSTAQYAEVRALGTSELKCPDKKVTVKPVGESRVVVSGCKRQTDYVLACRSPGPRERDYVTKTPAPPSDDTIDALSDTGVPEDQTRVMELRQQQINYSQRLVEIRLEDLQSGAIEGMMPRYKIRDMPKHWLQAECRYMHEE
jgi:hypothetical protein